MIRKAAVLTLIAAFVSATTPGFACTGISLKAQDGAAIRGRTLEFGFPMQSNVLVIPAGKEMKRCPTAARASSTPRATPLSVPMRSGFPPSSMGSMIRAFPSACSISRTRPNTPT